MFFQYIAIGFIALSIKKPLSYGLVLKSRFNCSNVGRPFFIIKFFNVYVGVAAIKNH